MKKVPISSSSGSVFLVLFGALGVLGILGVGMTTFIKGPLSSSVKLTRSNTAMSQMALAGQSAVMAATGMAGSGDCDNDNYIEPVEWRVDGTKPSPTGGGLIPLGIGVTRTTDPWGTDYGYCVWDHGPTLLNASCQQGTPGTNRRLAGTASKLYPTVAIISAGPDKAFTTTCRSFAAADVNANGVLGDTGDLEMVSKAATSDDDLIFTYTYEEATGASGGLWSLKSSDANTAVISKAIEVQQAKFTGTSMMSSIGYTQSSAVSCAGLGDQFYDYAATGNCYYKVNSAASWANAQASCEVNGGYLVSIGSAAEKTAVYANLTSIDDFFMGAQSDSEFNWRWTGGELSGIQFWQGGTAGSGGVAVNGSYTNWYVSEPNAIVASCLAWRYGGEWNDVNCNIPRGYVCEKTGYAPLSMQNGLKIADSSVVVNCNSTNAGVLRRTVSSNNLEMCDGTDWKAAGGGGNVTLIDNFSDGISDYVRNNIFLGKTSGGSITTGGGNIFLVADNYATATLTSGFGNTAMGKQVLRSMTTGSANTVMGSSALTGTQTASRTTAFGNNSCSALGNGASNNDNTCIGTAAMLAQVATQITSIGRYSGYSTTGAVRAVWIGGDAGNRNTSGVDNTAIGNYAFDNNQTGTNSTALGYGSLGNASDGPNVGVGSGALGSLSTGSRNTAIGGSALGSMTTFTHNTAIGYNAGRQLNVASGVANVAAGYSALYASTAGVYNVAVGSYAAASLSNNTSSRNVAVGRDALRDKATSTSENVAIGATAVKGTGSTSNNTGIGWSALSVVRSPSNVAIGYSAQRLLNSTTATVINTAVGSGALATNVSSANNTAIGYNAMNRATTLSNSVAVGYEALLNHTSTAATDITAVGYQALRSNTENTFATAVGHQALYSNTTGANNTAIGYQALYSAFTSTSNTAVGSGALYAATNTTGQNTAIGSKAGYAPTGYYNATLVGTEAGYGAAAATSDNVTAVGYRASYGTGAASLSGSVAFGSKAAYNGTTSASFGFNAGAASANQSASAGYLTQVLNGGTAAGAMASATATGGSGGNMAVGYRALVTNTGTGGYIAAGALANEIVTASGFRVLTIGYNSRANFYNDNTVIGANAQCDAGSTFGGTVIGYNAMAVCSSRVRLGNTSITAIEGQVAWTFPSDRRLKKDIHPSDLGLDFIMGLKPVSYRLKQGNGRLDYGFLAQDIEKSLDRRETNMIIRLEDAMKTYQMRHNDLIAPIVKAIQERQKKIEDLKRQVAELKNCEGDQ